MIRADTRARLTARDLELALLLLAKGSPERRRALEARLAAEGPDALLDEPELAARLLEVRTLLVPSEALFLYVLMRHALLAAHVDDRDLADYLASLLAEFGRRDRAARIARHDDQTHAYVADILADLERSDGPRRFRVTVHLGNWTLWMGGLFAQRVARRGGEAGVRYYEAMGRRGFAEASGHVLAGELGLTTVFETAAERFPDVRGALQVLGDRVFFPKAA